MSSADLMSAILAFFHHRLTSVAISTDMVTLTVTPANLLGVCQDLKNEAAFSFEQLTDIAGVDYQLYGLAEWKTERATSTGFDRAADRQQFYRETPWENPRFAVVYHLLSLSHNFRVRLRVFLDEECPCLPSVTSIWPAANWFERETFDLYGFLFEGHDDLRRLLTDYGFVGHPFRKDFPLSGYVEPRYDAHAARVIYEPVDITPRILVPRIIRHDNRYLEGVEKEKSHA